MSAPEWRGVAGEAAVSAEADSLAAAAAFHDRSAAGTPEQADSWPGAAGRTLVWVPPHAEAATVQATAQGAAGSASAAAQAGWFLPSGRAGLLPGSMTVSPDEAGSGASVPAAARAAAAGAPPWAAEEPGSAAGEPPPWENGPWPGPGAPRTSLAAAVSPARPPQPAVRPVRATGSWTPRTVLVTGLLPLVVPGLVAGLLGLRGSHAGAAIRRASWLAVAASLAWAVVIVVLIAASTGGSAAGCSYPAAVRLSYARAMADLRGGAPAATQAADLGRAAGQANSAAAAAGQLRVRTALSALAGDLQQARADATASRAVPAGLSAQLAADGEALTAACRS